jgi:hypothetical protein
MDFAGQPQVEVGVVDEDREVGADRVDLVEQRAEDLAQAGQVRDHLEEPDHRQVAHVRGEPRSLGLQAVSAQTENVQVAHRLPEVAHQVGAVEVAGGLAAGEKEAGHRSRRAAPV